MTIKIIHLVPSMEVGGAELMLKRLIQHSLSQKDIVHEVISINGMGPLSDFYKDKGIKIHNPSSFNGKLSIKLFFNIFKILKNSDAQILQTWMYHSDLIGAILRPFIKNKYLVWNIRGVSIPQGKLSLTNFIIKVNAFLSFISPDKIICCGDSVKKAHIKKGFDNSKMVVINNGYQEPKFNPKRINEIRNSLCIGVNKIVIGTLGRYDPLKDYKNFIDAASILIKSNQNILFFMAGKNLSVENNELITLLRERNIFDHFILYGETKEPNNLLQLFDIYCSSSMSEGFPNSLCEAMFMRIPCVATNAGDSGYIIGNQDLIVDIQDSYSLAKTLQKLVNMSSQDRGIIAKNGYKRVSKLFSINISVINYSNLYRALYSGTKK